MANREREQYECPLGNNREGCACPDCLSWRYERERLKQTDDAKTNADVARRFIGTNYNTPPTGSELDSRAREV